MSNAEFAPCLPLLGIFPSYAYTLLISHDQTSFLLSEIVRKTAKATSQRLSIGDDGLANVLAEVVKPGEDCWTVLNENDWDILNVIWRNLAPLELGMQMSRHDARQYEMLALSQTNIHAKLILAPKINHLEHILQVNELAHRFELRRQISEGLLHVFDSSSGLPVDSVAAFNDKNKLMREDLERFCRSLKIELRVENRSVHAYWRELPKQQARTAMLKEFRALGGGLSQSGKFIGRGALSQLVTLDGRTRGPVSDHLRAAFEAEKKAFRAGNDGRASNVWSGLSAGSR